MNYNSCYTNNFSRHFLNSKSVKKLARRMSANSSKHDLIKNKNIESTTFLTTYLEKNHVVMIEIMIKKLPFKAAVYIVGHQEKHAELFEGHQLHVSLGQILLTKTHRQPFQKCFRIYFSHLSILGKQNKTKMT